MLNKEIVKKNFSKYAKDYDSYSTVQNHTAMQLIAKNGLSGIGNILDIGCGTGVYTEFLVDKFPDARITALDISNEMIEVAKSKMGSKNVEFIVADAESIDKLKGHYDLISSNATFQWFNDLENVLVKSKQLLKEKGRISFSIFGPKTFCELNLSLQELFKKDISIVSCDFIQRDKLTEILKNHFKNVSVEEEIFQEQYESLLALFNKIKYTGTRGSGTGTKIFWTSKIIRELEQRYIEKFEGLIVTYQIFYCNVTL